MRFVGKKVMKSNIDICVMDKVRERRLLLDISQAKLADKLKMSVGFIAKIESESYNTHYNVKHLNGIAKILKCSLKDFFPNEPLDDY